MHYDAIWGWFVDQGIIKDIMSWMVGIIMGTLWGGRKAFHLLRKHVEHQAAIADALNTRTPGGLADILKAMGYTISTSDENNLEPADPADGPDMPGTEPGNDKPARPKSAMSRINVPRHQK